GASTLCAGALIADLRERVANATFSRQTPDGGRLSGDGGDFVFIGERAPLTNDDNITLARLLGDEVAPRLGEPTPIELAATLWERVRDRVPIGDPRSLEARRELGRAHLRLGFPELALGDLADDRLIHDPEAMLLRARAHLQLGTPGFAEGELSELASMHPE